MDGTGQAELLQRQARALGDPTRHALFRLIEEAPQPPGVRWLAERLAVHQSAVRQHLAKLVGADLVIEERLPPRGPGRPGSVYRRAPGVVGAWGTENPYERLAALLLDVVRTGRAPRQVGHEAGSALTQSGTIKSAGRSALDVLVAFAEGQGFEPGAEPSSDDPAATDVVLHRCPLASLAAAAPDVVCHLHLGLAEGLTDGLDASSPLRVTGMTRSDPFAGGCRLHVQPRAAEPAEPGAAVSPEPLTHIDSDRSKKPLRSA